MRRLIYCIFALLLMTMPGSPRAQQSLGIAAVINDKVISVYDLNMRLTLVMVFAGLPISQETRQRLAPQVLRLLIDDELKRQEGKRIGLTYTDKQVEKVMHRMEKSNNMPKGGLKDFLAKRNVEVSVLGNQIRADLAWKELVYGRYGRSVVISDEEIDEVLADIKSNEGKPEYRISEIFLPVDKPENDARIAALANRLIEQIRSGAKFAALARSFSKSPSAEKGGDLGWNRIGRLDQELDNALIQLQPGQLSPPVRTPDGYYILALIDQRTARKFGQPTPVPATVNLQQLFVPVAKGASPAVIGEAMSTARQAGLQAGNCKELDQAAQKFGSPLSGNTGDLKTNALGQKQRALIRDLPVMTASQPLRMPGGIMVLMVCRRDEVKIPEVSVKDQRNRIASTLRASRLSILARQYIRDLRRQAFVEIR